MHRFPALTALARAAIIGSAMPAFTAAQTCHPATSSNEAKIFGIQSLAMALGRGTAIDTDARGSMRVGFEVTMIPHISDATATPATCRPGKGPENANAVPALARVRLVHTVGAGFTVEFAGIPPVTLEGMRPLVLSAALGYAHSLRSSLLIAARVHRSLGYVEGPITCSEKNLHDATSECFQGTLSKDRYYPNVSGLEVALASAPSQRRVAWYGGAGYSRLAPRFQVHFLNQAGFLDTTRVVVDLNRIALFGGASWTFSPRTRGTAEVYATPDDGATFRVLFDALLVRGR